MSKLSHTFNGLNTEITFQLIKERKIGCKNMFMVQSKTGKDDKSITISCTIKTQM